MDQSHSRATRLGRDLGVGGAGIATSPSPGGVMLRRLAPAFILIALSIALAGSQLREIIGGENVAVLFASLTVLGIAVVLLLFVLTARELNRAHNALEQNRQSAQDLIELASDGIFIADLDGRFAYVNGSGCRMLGHSREEILGKTIVDFIAPEDEGRLREDRENFLQGGTNVSEWRLLTKSGAYVPVEVSAKILPDGRWVAFDRDISKRKHAEKMLRQAQERFELALKGADLATWDWNILTGEVVANPRCAEMRGFRPEEIGHDVNAYVADMHPDDRPGFQKAMNDCLEEIRPEFECEYRASTKNGGWVWLLSKGKIFNRDERGRPIRIVGTALDITTKKQAETEERLLAELGVVLTGTLEFEDLLTNLAKLLARDFADVCILDVVEDRGGIRRARVACKDPTNEWLSGVLMRTLADGEGHSVKGSALATEQVIIIPNLTPELVWSWAQTEEDQIAFRRADFKSAIAVPLMGREKALGRLSLLSLSRAYDRGDLLLAQAVAQRASTLLENARLFNATKRAVQARDEMLGVVAHDLRNPLEAIAALAAVVRLNGASEVGDEIGHAVNRMDRLIQDLIDVFRIESGHRLSLAPEPIDAAAIISDSLKAQKPLASSAGIELHLEAAPHLPKIWADRQRLLQVFENLVGNAIKFTKPGGKITLAVAAHETEVVFSVTDTGSGIASSHLPHVFDRFWQAPQDKRPGAGLGLAIVKGIVEAQSGRIWIQSTIGHGSTFSFTIPMAASKSTPIHRTAAE